MRGVARISLAAAFFSAFLASAASAEPARLACSVGANVEHFLIDPDMLTVSIWDSSMPAPKILMATVTDMTVSWRTVETKFSGPQTTDYSLDRLGGKLTVSTSDPLGSSRKLTQTMTCRRE